MIAAGCALVPLLAAALLAVLPAGWGARVNLLAAALAFGLAACLPWAPAARGGWLLADGLGVPLAALTGFVGLTAAWFNLGHVAAEDRPEGARLRLHHALFQALLGCTLLALLSDDLGVTWTATAAATAAAALAAGLPGPAAAEAAWRGLVPVGVGAAVGMFGTVALYLAARPALGPGWAATSWSGLADAAPGGDGAMLNLAFAFLLLGYGTAALAPLYAWPPDPRAACPTPLAVLSYAVPNAGLAVLLRLRGVMASAEAMPPGPPLVALGLLCVLLAAAGLWRRRDVGRFFALSGVGQGGVVCLAFGLGTPAATSGGLLHLAVHTLAGTATLQCVGRAARLKGGRRFEDQRGLLPSHPALGLPLAAGVIALAGLPPFGPFTSLFLILAELAREAPWLLAPVGAGVLVGAWALVAGLHGLCFGAPTPDRGPAPGRAGLAGAWLNLAAAVVLGALPGPVAAWMRAVAEALP